MAGLWIAETEARKVAAQLEIRAATGQRRMSPDDIAAIIAALGGAADKADIYAQLKLTLTCQRAEKLVQATIRPGLNMRKGTCAPTLESQRKYMIDIALTTEFRLPSAVRGTEPQRVRGGG